MQTWGREEEKHFALCLGGDHANVKPGVTVCSGFHMSFSVMCR